MLYKWTIYGLALLPVWWLEVFVLNRFPVLGVFPMLLPLAGVAVAVLEGEGLCAALVSHAHVLAPTAAAALDLLLKPDRLRATLRT